MHNDDSVLKDLKPRIEKSGKYFISDGGFHPGIPAALVRYVAGEHSLVSANVFVFVQPDWSALELSESTKQEFIQEILKMDNRIYNKGSWEKQGWNVQREFDFGGEVKKQVSVPLYLDELGELPTCDLIKEDGTLEELGMYIAGFNLITIFLVMPICMMAMWLFPKASLKPMANLFCWSLQKFTSPPYGAVLTLDAVGKKKKPFGTDTLVASDDKIHLSIRVAHHDTYHFTAVPAVAGILQILDDKEPKQRAGLYRQGTFAEPRRFLADLERMGLEVAIQKE